jgi:hypothetical protein
MIISTRPPAGLGASRGHPVNWSPARRQATWAGLGNAVSGHGAVAALAEPRSACVARDERRA